MPNLQRNKAKIRSILGYVKNFEIHKMKIFKTWAERIRLVARMIIPRNDVAIVKCHVTIPLKLILFRRFAIQFCDACSHKDKI